MLNVIEPVRAYFPAAMNPHLASHVPVIEEDKKKKPTNSSRALPRNSATQASRLMGSPRGQCQR